MKRTAAALWVVSFAGTLWSGCCCAGPPPPRVIGPTPVDAGFLDAGFPFFVRDAGIDAGLDAHAPIFCSTPGLAGAHCADGVCATDLDCKEPTESTIAGFFELRYGEPIAGSPYATARDPLPVETAPFNGFIGSLCVAACDLDASADTCGPCATCSELLTQSPLVSSLAFHGEHALFGEAVGLCRIDCTFDPAGRGAECPEEMTCDRLTQVCVEACSSDVECNTVPGVTYDGEVVAVVDASDPAVCDPATGRCVRASDATARFGDPCTSDTQCPSFGHCFAGSCAELGCTSIECGVGGVCLAVDARNTVCVAGCALAEDCGPGRACASLASAVGGFSGYCADRCADDVECASTETCTVSIGPTAVIPGRCVPECAAIGARGVPAGCAEGEACARNAFERGACMPLGGFCDLDASSAGSASRDCVAGQICDEQLATGAFADGHCVDPCVSDADCSARPGTRCVASGLLAGLCRQPCVVDDDCSALDSVCDVELAVCTEP